MGGPWRGCGALFSKGSGAQLLLCLLSAGLVCCQKGGGGTPPLVRLEPRNWNLPIDAKVGQVVSRLIIVDRDTHKDNISVSFSRVHARIGPFHDGSPYFQKYEIPNSIAGEKKFDIELARSLEGKFKAGDQFNLYVVAHDGQYHSKNEVYGRIEESRGSRIEGSPLLPTEAPLPTTSSLPASPVTDIPTSSPNSPKSTAVQPTDPKTGQMK